MVWVVMAGIAGLAVYVMRMVERVFREEDETREEGAMSEAIFAE